MTELAIDIVSDVVCPWCYIGKRRLERAREHLAPRFELTVRWLPYELNPHMPAAGMERRLYCERKFGSLEYANRLYANVAAHAAAEGLALDYERIARTPNTRAAHALIALAGDAGCQDAVVDALFEAYFVDGLDVGSPAVLADLAVACGLDGAATSRALADASTAARVAGEIDRARELGVDSVPSFVFHGRLLFSGAQDPKTIALALERAVARGL